MNNPPVLALSALSFHYRQGEAAVPVLEDLSLTLHAGEMMALVGASGSGKSTLLHLAGLLERPAAGTIQLNGVEAGTLPEAARGRLRSRSIGFVYQAHHLLPEFTAVENAAMPLRLQGLGRAAATAAATRILEKVGLGHRLHHRPAALSGGEQQRVAIARALVHRPPLLLADEPTGNLDPDTAETVFTEFLALARASNTALLIATHNPDLARRMDRYGALKDGQLVAAPPD